MSGNPANGFRFTHVYVASKSVDACFLTTWMNGFKKLVRTGRKTMKKHVCMICPVFQMSLAMYAFQWTIYLQSFP